jgi:hypothetical protein
MVAAEVLYLETGSLTIVMDGMDLKIQGLGVVKVG